MAIVYERDTPLVGNFLAPYMVGENLANIASYFGVPEIPLPSRLWKLDNTANANRNHRETMTGLNSVSTILDGLSLTPIPGGIERAVNSAVSLIKDTYKPGSPGDLIDDIFMAVTHHPYAIPANTGAFESIMFCGGGHVFFTWNWADGIDPGKALWKNAIGTFYKTPLNITAVDIQKPFSMGSCYYSGDRTRTFVGGNLRGQFNSIQTQGIEYIDFDTHMGSGLSRYYHEAFWVGADKRLTDDQQAAITTFPHALVAQQRSIIFDFGAVGIPFSRNRFGDFSGYSRGRFGGR